MWLLLFQSLTVGSCFCPGVAAVPMLVGHAGWEHLQPPGWRPHQVAGPAGPDPQSSWNLWQCRDAERVRTGGHWLRQGNDLTPKLLFLNGSASFVDMRYSYTETSCSLSLHFFPKCFSLPWYQVQSKVNLKYDSWHKEVLSKFGQMLGQNMQDFHAQISKVLVETFFEHLGYINHQETLIP